MPLRVDPASGETVLREVDLRLPGYIPVVLVRDYRSGYEGNGALGAGWRYNLDRVRSLDVRHDRIVVQEGDGKESIFAPIAVGIQAKHAQTGMVLENHPREYVVYRSPLLRYVYPKQNADGSRLLLGQIEDLNDNRIQFFYAGGRLANLVDTLGRELRFDYTGGRLVQIQLVAPDRRTPPSTVCVLRYDLSGDLIGVSDASGRERRYSYQSHLLVAYTNPLGGTHYAQYDGERRCTALWRSDGSVMRRLDYDPLRLATHVLDTEGYRSVYQCVPSGQVLACTYAEGGMQHYYYDEQLRLSGFTDPAGQVLAFQVLEDNVLAQLVSEVQGAFVHFGDRGLAERIGDVFDQHHALRYDEQGLLVEITTPRGARWTLERDQRGRVKQICSPEGRCVRLISGSGKVRVEDDLGLCFEDSFDLLGQHVERLDGLGRRRRMQYDAMGRLVGVNIDGGYQAQFSYDAVGNLVAAGDSTGQQWKNQYDAFGRLIAHQGGRGERWEYAYDREGRVARIVNSQRQTAQINYDGQGHLRRFVAFDGQTLDYDYSDGGNTVRLRQARGETLRRLNPNAELVEETYSDGATRNYLYGASGEVLALEDGDSSRRFGYDADGLLTSIEAEKIRLDLAYDADGNLTSLHDGAERQMRLSYDARCRLVEIEDEGGLHRLRYDEGNRLTVLTLASGVRFTFRYDLLDHLLERSIFGSDRERQDHHVFRPEQQAATLANPLLGESSPPGKSWATLIQGRSGLALVVKFNAIEVPLILQEDYLSSGTPGLVERIIWASVRPDWVERYLQRARNDLDLLKTWQEEQAGRMRWGYTDVPRSRELGRPARMMDRAFLDRACYDRHYPHRIPAFEGVADREFARSSDAELTGTHTDGYLMPSVWTQQTLGRAFAKASGVPTMRGIDATNLPGDLANSQALASTT